jgi:hypothetical protein
MAGVTRARRPSSLAPAHPEQRGVPVEGPESTHGLPVPWATLAWTSGKGAAPYSEGSPCQCPTAGKDLEQSARVRRERPAPRTPIRRHVLPRG